MDGRAEFDRLLSQPDPVLALAPMQDITDLPFWRLMAGYGGADLYFTEYFRVYAGSRLSKTILASVLENPTGRPAIAQLIGNDIPSLTRTARELRALPVAAVDLNLGCPAPVVYRKCAGGGLLRNLNAVDAILGSLRDCLDIRFTVKTRIGFEDPGVFPELLRLLAKHRVDLVTVHARTVKQMYLGLPDYSFIANAVRELPCPVLGNGNVSSAAQAEFILRSTGAKGLMIGRGAIRNPWLFQQIRDHSRGIPLSIPTGRQVLDYIRRLYDAACSPDMPEFSQVQRMKKYMNFLGLGVDGAGEFLHLIRRAASRAEFFAICYRFLEHDLPMSLDPSALSPSAPAVALT